ncbi:hypothetical protein ABTP53_19520, partial [Acinetobacter baumannii]
MPVEERLEPEEVSLARGVGEEDLFRAKASTALRTGIAGHDAEQVHLAESAETLRERGRLHTVATGVKGIEVRLSL